MILSSVKYIYIYIYTALMKSKQEAQLPQRNSASAVHVYLG